MSDRATFDRGGAVFLERPGKLVLDERGDAWVADTGHGRVLGADRAGRVHTVIAGGGLRSPTALAVERPGRGATRRVYIADPGAHRLWYADVADPTDSASHPGRIDPARPAGERDGAAGPDPGPAGDERAPSPDLSALALAGTGQPGTRLLARRAPAASSALPAPSALALDEDAQALYIAFAGSGELGRLDLAAGLLEPLEPTSNGPERPASRPDIDMPAVRTPARSSNGPERPASRPEGLALAPDRTRLYITDAGASAVRCLHLDTGASELLAGGAEAAPSPSDIAVSPAGLIVTDTELHALRGINLRHHTVVTIWRGHGDLALDRPAGVAFDRGDRSYVVVDSGRHRLLRIARDASRAEPIALHRPAL